MHFGHKNIITFDNRPFKDTAEMEEVLVHNWNSVVAPNDCVYHLGDFCWSKSIEEWKRILGRLNGCITLLAGNHDKTTILEKLGEQGYITNYSRLDFLAKTIDNFQVTMCHYPLLFYKNDYDPYSVVLCGHLHKTKEHDWLIEFVSQLRRKYGGGYENRAQIIPVECCHPWMDYTPRTLDYLLERLDKGEIYGV